MSSDNHAPHLTETRARQARWGRPIFWVLTISLTLAAIALVGTWALEWGPFSHAQMVETARSAHVTSQAARAAAPAQPSQSG